MNKWHLGEEKNTEFRYRCVSKKDRVGTVQYFEWLEGFTISKDRIVINLMPVIVSQ
jgi:hypothetical protein